MLDVGQLNIHNVIEDCQFTAFPSMNSYEFAVKGTTLKHFFLFFTF